MLHKFTSSLGVTLKISTSNPKDSPQSPAYSFNIIKAHCIIVLWFLYLLLLVWIFFWFLEYFIKTYTHTKKTTRRTEARGQNGQKKYKLKLVHFFCSFFSSTIAEHVECLCKNRDFSINNYVFFAPFFIVVGCCWRCLCLCMHVSFIWDFFYIFFYGINNIYSEHYYSHVVIYT